MNNHILYKTGDKDAPPAILDDNNEVVLDLCCICGQGEADLSNPCRTLNNSQFTYTREQVIKITTAAIVDMYCDIDVRRYPDGSVSSVSGVEKFIDKYKK